MKICRFILLCMVILPTQMSCSYLAPSPRSEFERNRTIWKNSGIRDYKMSVKIYKTGHAAPTGNVEIVVRGGVTKSIQRTDSPSVSIDTPRWSAYDSIDDIFNFIERSISGPVDKLDVEYDPQLGYPRKLDLDPALRTNDDELFFEVISFEKM